MRSFTIANLAPGLDREAQNRSARIVSYRLCIRPGCAIEDTWEDPAKHLASTPARGWRARAEEIRTVAESMGSDTARHTLDRLARNYEAMADQAENETRQREAKNQEAG
jgi:hypothetical protein